MMRGKLENLVTWHTDGKRQGEVKETNTWMDRLHDITETGIQQRQEYKLEIVFHGELGRTRLIVWHMMLMTSVQNLI